MTRMLSVRLVTLGDPGRLTGGYLYHRRMAERAHRHGAILRFLSLPDWSFPLPAAIAGAALLSGGDDAIVLDSIVAAYLGPWLALGSPRIPLLAMLHQPPGGIDHGPMRTAIQTRLDRLAYKRALRLLVASD